MYSRWKDWDGVPLAEAPGFYTEIDELAAGMIAGISRECMTTAQAIMVAHPEADLTQVISAHAWELDAYGPLIADKTSLMAALRTNSAHAAARHPMTEVAPGQFAPNFGHRFLAEDLPFGLVVVRGIAEIAGVETPTIDVVLAWSQERLGRQLPHRGRIRRSRHRLVPGSPAVRADDPARDPRRRTEPRSRPLSPLTAASTVTRP